MFRRVLIRLVFMSAAVFNPALAGDSEKSTTVVLQVENMTCSACPITVRKALEKVPGVSVAKVDLKTQSATVRFDPAKTSVDSLTAATTNAGFPSRAKKVM